MSSQGSQEQQQQVPLAMCKGRRAGAVPQHARAGEQLRLGCAVAVTALAQTSPELLCNGWVGTGCIPNSRMQLQDSRVGADQGFQSPLACLQPSSPGSGPDFGQLQAVLRSLRSSTCPRVPRKLCSSAPPLRAPGSLPTAPQLKLGPGM